MWRLVSNDREVFCQGTNTSVVKDAQRIDAVGAITSQVIFANCPFLFSVAGYYMFLQVYQLLLLNNIILLQVNVTLLLMLMIDPISWYSCGLY